MQTQTKVAKHSPKHETTTQTPSERLLSSKEVIIPRELPTTETTLYRDPEKVIRVHPSHKPDTDYEITLYLEITPALPDMSPRCKSYWSNYKTTQTPSTVQDLPSDIRDVYNTVVDEFTTQHTVSIKTGPECNGVCHLKHDHGKNGFITFKTLLKNK